MKNLFHLIVFLFISCSTAKKTAGTEYRDMERFQLKEVSTDPTYGSEKNPIEVGGVDVGEGPSNERRFLDALAGPKGENISYYRSGSCCEIKSKKGFNGWAMLDKYEVTWAGSKDTVTLYFNMYDYGELKAPLGFTIRK